MKRLSKALALAAALASAGCGGGPKPQAGAGVATDARALFARYCANCHGAGGEGRPLGGMRAPDFKSDFVVKLTDEQLYLWIARGGSNMPAFNNTLAEEEMRALVKHIRELQKQ